MILICRFDTMTIYMDGAEVAVLTFFPSGMPHQLLRVSVEQFLEILQQVKSEKDAGIRRNAIL